MSKEFFLKKNIIRVFDQLLDTLKTKDQNRIINMLPYTAKFKGNFPFDDIDVELLEFQIIGQHLGLLDQVQISLELNEDLQNGNSNEIEHEILEFDQSINWAAAGISTPYSLLSGESIFINKTGPSDHDIDREFKLVKKRGITLEDVARKVHGKAYNYQLIIFNVFPCNDRTFATFSYRKNDTWMQKLISQIKTGDVQQQKFNISKFTLSNCENIVFKPSVILALDEKIKLNMLRDFGIPGFGEADPRAIITNMFDW